MLGGGADAAVAAVPAVQASSTLSVKEAAAARHLYETWKAEGQGAVTLAVLKSRIQVVHLAECLLESGSLASESAFVATVGALCRPSVPRVLFETLFQFAAIRSSQALVDVSLLVVLLSMVVDMAAVADEKEGDDNCAARRMAAFALLRAQRPASAAGSADFDLTALVMFVNEWAPSLARCVSSYCISLFLPFEKGPSTFVPFVAPSLGDGGSCIVSPRELIPLGLYSSQIQGRLRRLYSSNVDGNSFQHILLALTGYNGPTLLLIRPRLPRTATDWQRAQPPVVFGAFSQERWREERRWYGSSSSFLFSLSPELKLYPARGSETNYQWLNTRAHSPKQHGLALGGSTDLKTKRLFLPSSLDECFVGASDQTYWPGALVPAWALRSGAGSGAASGVGGSESDCVDIDAIEVWAVGGDKQIADALSARGKQRELNADTLQKARQVDRAAFFGSAFDREMFLGKTFSHQKEAADRD